MSDEPKTREGLIADKNWLEDRIQDIQRMQKAYDAIKEQKAYYNSAVRDARKNVFKDGWFVGDYKWKGAQYQAFEQLGSSTIKQYADDYHWNWGDTGLDNLLNDLNRAIADRNNEITRKFGIFGSVYEILEWLVVEIENLVD